MDDFEKWCHWYGRDRFKPGDPPPYPDLADQLLRNSDLRAAFEAGQASERAATTPVIEAAERMLDESGFTEAVNSGDPPVSEFPPSYEQAIRALATYRAAVTKEGK